MLARGGDCSCVDGVDAGGVHIVLCPESVWVLTKDPLSWLPSDEGHRDGL